MILRALTILCVISSALISCNRSKYFRTTLAGREYPAGYDRNGDGITDIQAIKAQLNPADPNLASEDADGDGLTNLWEIKLGFDPKVADSANSLNGNKFGGNGVTDCQEDLVGDGIPICWKIKYGIDPAKGDRSLTDLDSDGYSDLEEYLAATDPSSANSRPGGGTADENGALAAVLTLKGTTSDYTEVTRVTGTVSYCASGEQVLFTSSATKPEVNDPGFVACSTASEALSGTLAAVKTGTYKMYAWRKIGAGVVETPLSASILYAPRAADSGLSVHPYSNKTLSVAVAAPQGTQYKSVRLFRYSELNCSSRTVDDATGTEIPAKISDSLILASGLSYTTPYCFKAFWKDVVGNVATQFGSYAGVGPIDGTLTISGLEEKTIKLAHTLPTDTSYSSLKISRFETTCAAIASGTATSIAIDKSAISYSDAGLKLATPYCYQATWADAFGNGKTETVEYAGTGPGAGTIEFTSFATQTINLKQTPAAVPLNPISSTALTRYQDLTCSSTTTTPVIVSPAPAGTANYSDSSGLTLNKSYCYKMAWFDAFGNASTKSVSFAGTGPTGGDMDAALDATAVNILITPPTPPPPSSNFTVALNRYDGKDSCDNLMNAADKSFAPAPISTDTIVNDAGGVFLPGTNYCYKIIWTDDFGNSSTAIKSIKFSSPTFTAPSSLTLNGSGTVTGTYTATLDERFSDNRVIKVLMGNGSGSVTSNGAVPFAQSDIPSLTYTDISGCGTSSNPFICPGTSNHSGTVTSGLATLGWNYTKFDQGTYDIKTLSYLNVDGTKNYGGAATTSVIISDPGQEIKLVQDSTLVSSDLQDPWHIYQPALAENTNLSSASAQVFGVVYSSRRTQTHQYIGKVVVDRSLTEDALTNTARLVFNDSGSTINPSFMIGDPDSPANSDSVAIASASSDSPAWLVLSTILDGSAKILRLMRVTTSNDTGTGANAGVITRLASPVTSTAGDPTFSSTAITPAFDDKNLTNGEIVSRHGIAFAASKGLKKGVFVSKIRSNPTDPASIDNFFDASTYYPGSGTSPAEITEIMPQAVPVAINLNESSLVKLVTSNENGTNFFYVGWREDSPTNQKVRFARVLADGITAPVLDNNSNVNSILTTETGHEIVPMATAADLGKGTYSLAAGKDSADPTKTILGVLYAPSTVATSSSPGNCRFTAYKVDVSTNPPKIKALASLANQSIVFSAISAPKLTECKFPYLYWNESSKKFMAIWLEDASDKTSKTKYAEFKVTTDASNNSLLMTPATPSEVIVTSGRIARNLVCALAANYSPGNASSTPPRIGIVTIEADDCSTGNTAEMRFDMYKPAR